ncbi:MAG: CapA family protein [Coriobacteriales bacterium]|nr:CapA family protein [Coriobacteriales bacterium]
MRQGCPIVFGHAAAMRAVAVIACLAAVAAVLWFAFLRQDVPDWVVWEQKELRYGGMSAQLDARRVTLVDEQGKVSVRTPSQWLVQSFCVCDANRDGVEDLVLLAWRRGKYADSRPFWVLEDERTWSQHVFVVDANNNSIEPVWMSSGVGVDVVAIDKGESGHIFLTHRDGVRTAWEWGTWGFALMDQDDTTKEPHNTASILVTGDIIAHESLFEQAWVPSKRAFEFDPMFELLQKRVSSYDLAVASQETVFVHDSAQRSGYPLFGTPESLGDAEVHAGYDVVCCATNHAADKGEQGIADTLAFWRGHPSMTVMGMHGAGESAVRTIDVNGYSVALLNATASLNGRALPTGSAYAIDTLDNVDELLGQLKTESKRADFTLCLLHMGSEYAAQPTTAERDVAQRFANVGADAIVCTHPHVLQPVETIRSDGDEPCIVYWSLGNLLSHQDDPRTVVGGAATIVLGRGKDGAARVVDHKLLHTVSHVESGYTAAFFVDDYSEEMAKRHWIDYTQWY